jgi:hypothetical protein
MTSLSLVRGVVQNLIVTKGHEDFVFHSSDKNITDVVAIGAAATEQLFNSVILTSAVGDAEISVDRFTCTVNNVVFTGRFHEIQFKSGDEIEFVVEMTQNNGVVYAARSPSMRLLWMMPHQMRGKAAQKKSDVKWSLIIALCLTSIFELCDFFFIKTVSGRHWKYDLIGVIGFFSIVLLVCLWVRRRLFRHSLLATEVIKALGYENPDAVDLPALSKYARKNILQLTGKDPGSPAQWSFWY